MYTFEQAIERVVEHKFDRLDDEYLNTPMTEEEYQGRCIDIKAWAEHQYKLLRKRSN